MKRAGGILTAAVAAIALALPGSAAADGAFHLTEIDGSVTAAEGGPLLDAGSHPDFTTKVSFSTHAGRNGTPAPDGNVKDVNVLLPPGFVGNPNATPTCSVAELLLPAGGYGCSPEAQIGTVEVTNYFFYKAETFEPLYNIEPPAGVASEFGFNIGNVLVFLDSGAVDDGEYRIETKVSGISQGLSLGDTEVTLWGVPASPAHDAERLSVGGFEKGQTLREPRRLRPLLRAPTSCTGAVSPFSATVDSWGEPGNFTGGSFERDREGNPIVFGNCGAVPFAATISARPTTSDADSPSGLDFTVRVPQNESANGLAVSDLRDATVTLPEGMTVNPAAAGGLGTCSVAQIELGGNAPASCPAESKLGTVEIVSPLIDHPLQGSVYLARQGENEFGSLLAIYLAVDDEASGTILKLAGRIAPDPTTGRIVVSFTRNPQLPFESLSVELAGGTRAPLTTPSSCGTYGVAASLAPWSGNAPVEASDSFAITSGPNGSACPSGDFAPKLEATPASPLGGSYAPLDLTFSRADGTARLGGIDLTLPRGLLAKLAGIPYCSDATLAGIPTAPGSGAAEAASASCPSASRIGSVSVAAGSGASPFYANRGAAYLAGPYRGAPLSLAIAVPALAGPFDLGNVVVRVALRIDPQTTQVTAVSDPLPTILDGVPIDLRSVDIALDRPSLTVAPTSCEPHPFAGSATSASGASAALGAPFGAVGCAGLDFAPKLALSLKGSKKRGGYPRLTAKLRAHEGDANLGVVSVTLPHTEFLAQNHIGTVCTRVQFAAAACPKGSVYGYAEATTPLLSEPLRGPVYLRANGGERKLPDLVASLGGQIPIDLVGFIDTRKGGIRTRFLGIPDAPVTGFTLRLKGGAKGLLQNSAGLCGAKAPRAAVSATGQNGKRATFPAPLAAGCPKRDGGKHR